MHLRNVRYLANFILHNPHYADVLAGLAPLDRVRADLAPDEHRVVGGYLRGNISQDFAYCAINYLLHPAPRIVAAYSQILARLTGPATASAR